MHLLALRIAVSCHARVPRRRKVIAAIGAGLLVTTAAAAGNAIARTDSDGAPQRPALTTSRVDPRSSNPGLEAPLPEPPGTTERVSVADDETQGNGASGGASAILSSAKANQAISADGRWVAFVSASTDLIPGSPRPAGGVYVRDRQSGATVAVPWVDGRSFPAGITAAEPAISGDGTVIAFTAIVTASASAVLLAPTTTPYVLAWDRQTNTTAVVSVDSNSQPTPGWQPSISADGRYVAYTMWAPPDTTPPILSNLTANPTHIGGCTGPASSTISVTATDPDDAVSAVTLYYTPNGGSTSSQPMSPVGSNVWQGTITLDPNWSPGQITYWVQGTDSHGNTSTPLYPSSANILTMDSCIL
jgi:hypothetical protein